MPHRTIHRHNMWIAHTSIAINWKLKMQFWFGLSEIERNKYCERNAVRHTEREKERGKTSRHRSDRILQNCWYVIATRNWLCKRRKNESRQRLDANLVGHQFVHSYVRQTKLVFAKILEESTEICRCAKISNDSSRQFNRSFSSTALKTSTVLDKSLSYSFPAKCDRFHWFLLAMTCTSSTLNSMHDILTNAKFLPPIAFSPKASKLGASIVYLVCLHFLGHINCDNKTTNTICAIFQCNNIPTDDTRTAANLIKFAANGPN